MRASLIALAAAAVLAGAGCGDEEDTTTTTSSSTTTEETTAPSGELTADGVGELKQGTSLDEAVAAFGEPTERERFPGCELDPNAKPVVQLTYDLADGELILTFAAASAELESYRTTSEQFETTLGDHVGDAYESVRDNWGNALEPLSLGVPATPEDGFWFVQQAPRSQLLFAISGGEVESISGGYLPPCE
jgi:hypothetical protein